MGFGEFAAVAFFVTQKAGHAPSQRVHAGLEAPRSHSRHRVFRCFQSRLDLLSSYGAACRKKNVGEASLSEILSERRTLRSSRGICGLASHVQRRFIVSESVLARPPKTKGLYSKPSSMESTFSKEANASP